MRRDHQYLQLPRALEGPFHALVVHSASLCLHTRLSLGTGDDLHKRMRFHASSRSPSRLVRITIVLTLDDVTWTTSLIPTCPLQHWAPPDVDTAHRLHYARLTLVLTLDDVTGVTSVTPSRPFQHYACADISIATMLAVTWRRSHATASWVDTAACQCSRS